MKISPLPTLILVLLFIPTSNLLTFPLFISESNAVRTRFVSDQKLFPSPIKLRNLSDGLPFKDHALSAYPELAKTSTQQDINKVRRIITAINKKTYHCEFNEPQNFLHTVAQKIVPTNFKEYGLLDFRYLQCGFCHQRNYLLVEILISHGFASKLVGLNGHVVGSVFISNKEYFVDADLDVGPFLVNKRFSTSFITSQYKNKVDSESKLNQYLFAYATTQDDSDYDLANLRRIQELQEKTLNFLNFTLTLSIILLILCSYRIVVLQIRKRKNFIR